MIIFKITDDLLRAINEDLSRQHPFAAERIGFLTVRSARAGKATLLLATGYYSIPDDQYVDDSYSGARINSQAISGALQLSLDTGDGVFHVHAHYFGNSIPSFGRMDMRETPKIVASLQAVKPEVAHGMLLLNYEKLFGLVRLPGAETIFKIDKLIVVGYPTKFSINS